MPMPSRGQQRPTPSSYAGPGPSDDQSFKAQAAGRNQSSTTIIPNPKATNVSVSSSPQDPKVNYVEQNAQDDLETSSLYDQPTSGKGKNTSKERKYLKFLNVKKDKTQERVEAVPPEDTRPMSKKLWRHLRRDVQTVKTEELKETDTVIVLMGPTGSGKSSFISTVAGIDQGIGHDLWSSTAVIKSVRVRVPDDDIDVVLVDTPGFDDTHRSDREILEVISDWIKQAGYKNILLDGILYLHRISDNRMAGTPLRNLEVFEKICGPKACSRVVMMTTMWDEVENEDVGERREQELVSSFWQPMVTRGSSVVRYLNTPESAWGILDRFLVSSKERSANLQAIQLQKETVKQQKTLNKTDAGHELFNRIDEIDKKRRSLMRILKKQMDKHGADEEVGGILRREYEALEKERDEALGELHKLKVSVPQRYLKSVSMKARYR